MMKRLGSSVIIAMIVSALLVISAAAALLGDANNDGSVKSYDARKILRHAAKVEIQTDPFILKLIDVDGSGKINARDARLALRMASRLEATKEYVEPGTEAPAEPTTNPPAESSSVPDLPIEPLLTTRYTPTEPTSEAPTEPTSDVPTAPTSEAPTAPTSEAPTEPTAPVAGIEYHDSFYVDTDIISFTNGKETGTQRVKVASSTEEVTGALNKTYTLNAQYIRSDVVSPGREIGFLIRDELNSLRTGTKKTIYMIDYEDKEYVSIDGDVLTLLGVDFDEMMAGNPIDDMKIPVFTDLRALNATEEEYEGKTYQVVTIDKDGTFSKYFVEPRDGKYYPVIVESYADDMLLTRMVIYEFSTDAAAYTAAPIDMKEYPIRMLSALTDFTSAMPFFQKIGIM